MSTARDLIKSALRQINVLASGETPDADQAVDALSVLNQVCEAISLDTQLAGVYSVEQTIACTGAQSYNLATRMIRVDSVVYREPGGTDYPVKVIEEGEWLGITTKTMGGLPEVALYEAEHPTAQVKVWPQPNTGSLLVYGPSQVINFPALDTVVSLPTGFERLLRYTLAMELAPEYGRPVDPFLLAMVRDARTDVRRANIRPMDADLDPGVGGGSYSARADFIGGK